MRYGEEQIANARLEAVPNPAPDRDYRIDLTCPEFTCLCPRSGFPDFATFRITYVPDQHLAELKSVKLYLNRFRNEYLFHEAAVNQVLDDLVATIQPRWLRVIGDFTVRGNIKTVITAIHARPGYVSSPWLELPSPARDGSVDGSSCGLREHEGSGAGQPPPGDLMG